MDSMFYCYVRLIPFRRRAISSQLRHILTIGKKTVKQQCLLHMSSQYGELWPTSGWDRSGSLGHISKFRWVLHLGSVTVRHSSIGRQPNVAALNRQRHLYSAGRPSHWALAQILVTSRQQSTFVQPKMHAAAITWWFDDGLWPCAPTFHSNA